MAPVFEKDTDGVTHVDPTKRNQICHDRWSAHWDKRRSQYDEETTAMDVARRRALQDDPLPCIRAADIRAALKGVKPNTGKSADGVGPQHIASLPDEALGELGKLPETVERRATIPIHFNAKRGGPIGKTNWHR